MGDNLYQASSQWATRPADERFWNIDDLHSHLQAEQQMARELVISTNSVEVVNENNDLTLSRFNGKTAKFTHWSFGQLCSSVGAPASYLQQLPPDLACQNLNYGLKKEAGQSAKLLFRMRNNDLTLRSVNGADYGRIWDTHMLQALRPALDLGWRTPPARPSVKDARARPATEADILPNQDDFGLSVKVGDMIAPAGVYRGDRDMFIFLVNPNRIIDDGGKGLMRGVFLWNSEVGGGAYKVKTFYLENVCGNHIVWGVSKLNEIKIFHRRNAAITFGPTTLRELKTYANASTADEEGMILSARQTFIAPNRLEVIEKLSNMKSLGMSRREVETSFDTAIEWEHTALSAPTTVWGFVHGLTRYSQQFQYADERARLDRIATKLLALAV
jgi:hypothetical protein